MFFFRQLRILLRLRKSHKRHVQADIRTPDVVVLDVGCRTVIQLLRCGLLLEFRREVHDLRALVGVVVRRRGMHHRVFQGDDNFITVRVLPRPERTDACVGAFDVLFLFQVGQVLPVADRDAFVIAPGVVQDGIVAVEFPLAAIDVDNGPLLSEKQRAQVVRLCDFEPVCGRRRSKARLIGQRERIILGAVLHKPGQGVSKPCRRKAHDRDVRHLVANVLRVNLNHAGERL